MYQKLIIIGRLSSDPTMRYTQDGTPVTSFSIAVNKKWTVDGEKREQVTWFRVSAWRKLAETCNQYLEKGRLVLVEGELEGDRESGSPRVWTDNSGEARASFEMTAKHVRFLDSKDEGE